MWFTVDDARKALGENHAQLCYLDRLKSNVHFTSSSNDMSTELHVGCCPPKLSRTNSSKKSHTSPTDDDKNQNNSHTANGR